MSSPPRAPLGLAWVLLALCILVGLLYLPGLDLVDFHREEGRRVIPAREMLASGDFVVPTIWGEPYLSKPPGYFWLLALFFRLAGGVSEFAARSSSVLAVLLTSSGLALLAGRAWTPRAGWVAGAFYAIAFESVSKGRLAEIETTLALTVFVAVMGWALALRGVRWAAPVAGMAFGAALLCKGPAALIYVLAPPVALSFARRSPRFLLSSATLWTVGLGLGLAGLWLVALFRELEPSVVTAHWSSEVGGQGGGTLGLYLRERLKFVLGSLPALAPASLVVLLALRKPSLERVMSDELGSVALWSAAAGWCFFLLFPGTNVRYAQPCLPFLALVAARILEPVWTGAATDLAPRLARLASGMAIVGLAAAAASFVGLFRPLGEIHVDALGALLGAVLAAASLGALPGRRLPRRLVLALFVVPSLGSALVFSQSGRAESLRHAREPDALELTSRVPAGEPLHVAFWRDFNTLLYVDREVRFTPRWTALEGEAWVLVDAAELAAYRAQGAPRRLEVVQSRRYWDGENALVHLLP